MQSHIEDWNLPTAKVEMTELGSGVDCRIYKRGYFKFDAVRLKTLSTNAGPTP